VTERTFAQPSRLAAYARVGAATTPAVATRTAEAVGAADRALSTADDRLPRAAVAEAIGEVEETLGALRTRMEQLDLDVARLAQALQAVDRLGLGSLGAGIAGLVLEALVGSARVAWPVDADSDEAVRGRAVEALLGRLRGASPQQVADVFAGLDPDTALGLATTDPVLVGRLDGVPAWVRDHANRRLLSRELERLAARLEELDGEAGDLRGPAGTARRQAIRQARLGLLDRQRALEAVASRGDVALLVFDAGAGRIAAAVGDTDRAEHTAVLVPGTGSSIEGFDDLLVRAREMTESGQRAAPDAAEISVVAWLDYDAPPGLVRATSPGRAVDATEGLARFVEGLAVGNPASTRTLVGHSYGSTVVGATARKHELDVVAVVGVASPGMRTDAAGDYLLTDDARTYAVTDSDDDLIDWGPVRLFSTRLGPNPADSAFGALSFDVSDAGGHGLQGYVDQESEAGRNLGRVIVGRYGELTP
jgi:pimeloyl-ACP methyl ester carboxylesterase